MKLAKIFFAIFIIFSINLFAKGMPSEYYAIKDTKKAKVYFSEYIYKLTEKENLKILEERNFVKNLLSSSEIKTTIDKKQLKMFLYYNNNNLSYYNY